MDDRVESILDDDPANDAIIAAFAQVAHENNRQYCRLLGDDSQPRWEDAPEWQRVSVMKGVRGVLAGNDPERSHECWLAEKRAEGWTWGPVKDVEKKLHPCFVPYDELSEEQKRKDHLFVSTVQQCVAAYNADRQL